MAEERPRRCKRSPEWNRAEGRKHLEAQAESGLSIRAYCLANNLAEWTFYNWRRRIAFEAQGKATPSMESPTPAKAAFAELVIPSAGNRLEPWMVEIVLRGERRIRVGPGFDEETLRRLVSVMESLSC